MEDYPISQLSGLVLPCGRCPTIGQETRKYISPQVTLFFQSARIFNPYANKIAGSYRFVATAGSQIVAGLQIMSETGRGGIVANVFCRPEWRRQGYATALLDAARDHMGEISISQDRLADGHAWAAFIEKSKTESVLDDESPCMIR